MGQSAEVSSFGWHRRRRATPDRASCVPLSAAGTKPYLQTAEPVLSITQFMPAGQLTLNVAHALVSHLAPL